MEIRNERQLHMNSNVTTEETQHSAVRKLPRSQKLLLAFHTVSLVLFER